MNQLGTRGGSSDPELWRALRFGSADITASNNGPAATTLVQDGGMKWLMFRQGPLATYGAYLLGGTLLLLAIFYLIRGRICIDGAITGRKIERFKAVERFGHWLLAGGIEDIVYSWPLATMREHEPMPGKALSFQEKPETLTNGERQFKRKCSICHTLTRGSARKAGPSLHGLFGRRAGTIADYTYSDTLEGSEIVWSAETIDALFDLGPDHYIPSTKMPMQRIVKQTDRNDLIDYLRAQTAQKED